MTNACPNLKRSRLHPRYRQGMTVIVVLGVISITLALSYAMLRSQVTAVEIQSNLERRNLARQAAYAGISAALHQLHSPSWAGVDTQFSRDLASQQWFEVGFTTGDLALTATDPEYHEYPFRVTIESIGYAADPAHPDVRSSYRVRAVVQLVREKLNEAPSGWEFVRNFTAYQWSGSASYVEVPVRVDGPCWLQGPINIGADYPIDSSSRTQYYNDLTAMKNANRGDFRPFNGPLLTPFSKQTGATRNFLTSGQGLTLIDVPVATGVPVSFPTNTSSYQLYPGGKSYSLPVLQSLYGNTITQLTLAPDPIENPLGIYLSNGTLFVDNNTTVKGTIITTGSEPDIRITGQNVLLQGQALPPIEGATVPTQLPVAIVKDDFHVLSSAQAAVRGVVVAFDEFSFIRGDVDTRFDMQGRAICNKLYLYGRASWDLSLLQWQTDLLTFNTQKLLAGGIRYFPEWMKNLRGMDPNPLLTIKPDSPEIVHHWHAWDRPVYTASAEGVGLRWNLIDWIDNPSP